MINKEQHNLGLMNGIIALSFASFPQHTYFFSSDSTLESGGYDGKFQPTMHYLQLELHHGHHGNQHFVRNSDVSLIRDFRYISGRRGIHNKGVEYNVAAFSELSFAVRWQGRLSRGYYYE